MATDADKLVIARLLMAIDDYRKSVTFTLNLPPKHGELEDKLTQSQASHCRRALELEDAMKAARAVLA